jgi:hypothetical protein
MKINGNVLPDSVMVLGTKYKIFYETEDKQPKMKGNDGYCEAVAKEIHIAKDLFVPRDDPLLLKDLAEYGRTVIRHEIVHAFFIESGLAQNSSYADNEELVDWIARQFPKMTECFEKAGITGVRK